MNELLQTIEPWAEVWGASLWRASWQGGLAIIAAWAIARWCTFLSPRVVCWVWRLACLKLLIALVSVQPVSIPVLPASPTPVATAGADLETRRPAATQSEIIAPRAEIQASPVWADQAKDAGPVIPQATPWSWLFILWLFGVSFRVALTTRQWRLVRSLCQLCETTPNAELQQACRREADRLSIRRTPQIRLSPRTDGPLLAGIRRPLIILPAGAVELFDERELRLMLSHELAHLKRRDLLWNWLPTVVGWLFFFHPLVWLLPRRWSEAQEAACDELLIQTDSASPAAYGRFLVKLAARWPRERRAELMAAGVLGTYRNLERRILAMTRVKPISRSRLFALCCTTCLVAALGIVPWRLAAQQPAAATDEKPQQPTAVKEALAGLAKSLQAMRGYDVYMTVKLEWPYKFELVDVEDVDHPTRTKKFELRPWNLGEKPMTAVSISRHVMSRDGKQRIEREEYDSKTELSAHPKSLAVFDGKTLRKFNGTTNGIIEKRSGYCLEGEYGYQVYDGEYLTDHIPLEYLIGERPSARIIEDQGKGSDLVGILFPGVEGQTSWPDLEFRVWLDRNHGFLPKKIETYRRQRAEMRLYGEMNVVRFSKPKPGVWAPTEMTYTAFELSPGPYQGKAVNVYHANVDVGRSRWNIDLDDNLYLLPFPAGVQVADLTTNLMFTTAPGDDGKDIKQLIGHATKSIRFNTGAAPEKLDLAHVRQPDRDAAAALLKYEADLKASKAGAITRVIVQVEPQSIGLGGPNLDDEGLAEVGKLRDLEELYLGRTNITDAGLTHLEGLTHLKVLILENTKITDAGLKHLASLTDLKRLYLDNNIIRDGKPVRAVRITDEGLANLKSLTKLESLVLFGTAVTNDGVAELKQALPNCQVARDDDESPNANRQPAATPAPNDKSTRDTAPSAGKEQGSQLLRDIQKKEVPILAAMAKDHGYRLDKDQNIRRLPPPFPMIRMEWYRAAHTSQAESIPEGPSMIVFRWSNGHLSWHRMGFGDPAKPGYSLSALLDSVAGIKRPVIEAPSDLLDKLIPGDWVVREGATDEQVVKEFNAILQNELSLPVRMEFHRVERPVVVVDGTYQHKPVPGGHDKDTITHAEKTVTLDAIDIFGKQLVPTSGAGGGVGRFSEFLNRLSEWVGTPIVSDVKSPPQEELSWFLHARSPFTKEIEAEDHDPKLVLANISAQTGLRFRKETRPMKILFVSPGK